MKRVVIFAVTGNPGKIDSLYEKYKNEIPKGYNKYLYKGARQLCLPFEPDSLALADATAEYMREQGTYPRLFSDVYCTKKELEAIPFFSLDHLPSSLEMAGTSPDEELTKYEIMCPECGFRTNLQSNIVVDGPYFKRHKNKQICELHPSIVVSANLKELIETSGLTGVSFDYRVQDYKQREVPEFYAMTVSHILPPMSSSAWFSGRYDYPCGHYRVYLDSEVQYEREKLDGAMDFNLTHEYVNNGRSQKLIVSAKVRTLFKENKIRAHFTPVSLL